MKIKGYTGRHASSITAATGFLYFVAYFVFSMIFLRERFMIDGAYMIFEMANTGSFPAAQNRFIIWLLDILPLLSIKLGLPLKTVMVSWVVNFTVFYAACFYFILYGVKSRVYAWFLLFTQLLVMVGSFYNISNEISPSAALAVVLLAIVNNKAPLHSYVKNSIITICLFFTVFGHILVPVGLLAAAVYHYVVDKEGRPAFRKSYLWIGILFALMFIVRIYLGTADPYERNNMVVGMGSLSNILSVFNRYFISDLIYFYMKSFAPVGIVLLFLVYRFTAEKRYIDLLLLTLILAGFFLMWHVTVTSLYPGYGLSIYFDVHTRWLFPFNFIILFAFTDYLVRSKNQLPKLSPLIFLFVLLIQVVILKDYFNWERQPFLVVCTLFAFADLAFFFIYMRSAGAGPGSPRSLNIGHFFILVAFYQFSVWYRISDYPRNNVDQYEQLDRAAKGLGGNKFFVLDHLKCDTSTYHTVYSNSIVFTAMQGPEHAKQIVFAKEEDIAELMNTADDALFMARYVELDIRQLNEKYFAMEEGPYRSLDVDLRDCDFNN